MVSGIPLAGYSSATAYIVIVMVALAEELVAPIWLVVISLSGMLVSAIEMTAPLSPNRIKPSSRATSVTEMTSLVTASSP
jgi:hypothetical protein